MCDTCLAQTVCVYVYFVSYRCNESRKRFVHFLAVWRNRFFFFTINTQPGVSVVRELRRRAWRGPQHTQCARPRWREEFAYASIAVYPLNALDKQLVQRYHCTDQPVGAVIFSTVRERRGTCELGTLALVFALRNGVRDADFAYF